MSGSRRNRILNLNASTVLPNHHTLQPSSQQVRPALAHAYQQQLPAPVNNPVAASVPPRPMVIQYAAPQQLPNRHTPPQTRPPHPSQIPTPTRALPSPSPTHTRTNTASDSVMEKLSQSLVAAITPRLVDHEKSVAATIEKIKASIEKFADDVKEARNETDNRLFRLTEAMNKSLQIQQAHIVATNKRTEKIEALITASYDRNDDLSLVSRLENVQYMVGELSERVKDPVAQDFCIFSHPAHTANTIETRVFPTPPPKSIEESPLTPVPRTYEDKMTFCDIPQPLPERTPSPIGPIYKDVASDAMNLEPESSAMTSLIQPEYKNVGNDPRTPSPPCQSPQILNSGLELSLGLESDRPHSRTSSFREKSLGVTVEYGSHNDNESLVDIIEEDSGSKLKRQRSHSFKDSEEDGIVMEHSEDEGSMVIDVDSSLVIKSPIEFDLGPQKMMTDNEAHDDAKMDYEQKSEFRTQVTIDHPPTFTSRSLTSDGESVTAPRQTVCSSPRESSLFTPSQEQRTLPSPATTPSVPASPKSSPPADSTIATTPILQFPKERPVLTVLSPTSSSNREIETSLVNPDYAESPPTPKSASLFNVNVTPYSDNGSEIAVSHMVTTQPSDSPGFPRVSSLVAPAPEHAEQPQTPTSLDDIPLFCPSRSQSPPPLQVDDASLESSRSFLESTAPTRKLNHSSPSQFQSTRPTTPVVIVEPTSSTNIPATIFNTPFNKLRSGNSRRNPISVVSTPQKTQTIKCPVVRTPRSHVLPQKQPAHEPIVVRSSPIFVFSRSPSPLSVISSTSAPELGSDSDHESVRVMKKKQGKKSSNQTVTGMSTSTSASVGPSNGIGSGSSSTTIPRRIDLSQKVLAKKGNSAALTRVKKRKVPTAEQMEPPLKRARREALGVEVEREIRVKNERLSVGLPSVSSSGNVKARGKGKTKEREREREDDKGYKLPNIKTKPLSKKEEKKLRPRALPQGVKWPQKNASGDKKFDQQFIECEKCYLWYHYGCIGITDVNDAVAKGEKMFICPPCTGGGANPMLPSDNIVCARPDCEREEKKENEFFMTAIIGRYTRVSSGIGRKYMWLVKWDGYSITDCTWEEENGMSDPQSFIQDFYRKATKEGKDPDEDPYSTILLREAISGGWTDPNA